MSKILILDDDTDILEVVKLLLTHHKYEVHTTSDPEEIAKQIKMFKPDLILLDVNIGKYDGREICKLLKSDIIIKHIPVVLFSAIQGLQDTYPECEATGFIAKPFDAFELIETIEEHLKVA